MCNVIDDYRDKELSKAWKKIEGAYRFIWFYPSSIPFYPPSKPIGWFFKEKYTMKLAVVL